MIHAAKGQLYGLPASRLSPKLTSSNEITANSQVAQTCSSARESYQYISYFRALGKPQSLSAQ